MRLNKIIKVSLLGLAFFVVGCGGESAPIKSDAITLTGDSVHWLGRYHMADTISTTESFGDIDVTTQSPGSTKMGWPGSGITFRFDADMAMITIQDDGEGFMDLRVNGVERVIDLKPGENLYRIGDGERDVYDVRLTRRSEFYDTGYFSISRPMLITSEGTPEASFLPPNIPDRKILFLGDSITAGFGVAGETKDCANTPALHAPTQSYAMLAADGLNAEPQLIAISGRGVVHNWDANPAPVMPAQIDFALPDQPETTWDHSLFIPDVVVTLLGTNDWSVIDPGRDKFRAGYRDMLADLRARFPMAHIVTVSGPLLDGAQGAAIRDGIDGAMADIGDANISTLDLKLADHGLIWSCNSHPGRTSMKRMANDLMAHVQAQLGWDYTPIDMPPATVPSTIAPPDRFPPDGKAHYSQRIAEIAVLPIIDGGTLLIGDSITEGWEWSAAHRALLPNNVTNHGIGWDTTDGVIARLPQILPNHPERIFVMIGTNDISQGRTTADIAQDFEIILRGLRRENRTVKIYVQPILPRETDKRSQIAEVNRTYRMIAEKYDATYINLTTFFAAPDGTLKAELTEDGLHLNEAGYRVWRAALLPYLPQ